MSVRPRYWLPPALLAHVDDGGVYDKLETPGQNANGRGIRRSVQTLGTWRSRNPEASGSARSVVPRGSKIGGAESLPPRSWFTKHSISTCISHPERKSSLALHGVEARPTAASRWPRVDPSLCRQKKSMWWITRLVRR
ncbi:hypothetical protein DPMN_167008 [Dreissena polymorpha]|uniref:Uncharacterized protein n=1 Tax=Dreissena polymorpha TaxID=45954 RepID=A0A9D4F2G3_DREPO|nr:hypothetical protein DPMN_167008 [Dreissena polymorpha]